jgi:hypothetical protein
MVEQQEVRLPTERGRLSSRWAQSAGALILATLMLSWVAIANRSPLPFPDSRSYWVGGYTATQVAAATASRLWDKLLPSSDPARADRGDGVSRDPVRAAAGVRSVSYSLFVYAIGTALSLWGVTAVQSLALAWIVLMLTRCLRPHLLLRHYLLVIAVLCVLTSAPWLTGEIMPDVFTSLLIASMIVVFLDDGDMPRGSYLLLAALLTFAISTHASHFPLALALLVAGLMMAASNDVSWRRLARLSARAGSPVAVAVAGTLAVSLAGFHQLSLAPQSPPFLLARSLQDGPALLLLKESCPASGYEMCRHLEKIPERNSDFVWNFLWAPESVYMSASPEMRERIRREELPIVFVAARNHLKKQVEASVSNVAAQVSEFGAQEFYWGGKASIENGVYSWQSGSRSATMLVITTALQYAAVLISAAGIACGLTFGPFVDGKLREAALLLAAAVVVNAAICGILSEPSPRYQARITWLVVTLGLICLCDFWRRRLGSNEQP